MKLHLKIFFTVNILFFTSGYINAQNLDLKPSTANKLNLARFTNLYKVDDSLYRSEQPSNKGFILLDSVGIKTIINLRQRKTDNYKIKKTGLELVNVPMNAWTISYSDIVASMRVVIHAKKPILIHCKHGADRTGCIVAIYRIVKCGWTREDAIKEFRYGGFHYHEKSFPNILRLLETVDIEQIKKDIKE
ncbi:MAG TPA: dual specificity protein phosphatase family protein [Bacteroidia bacterium]|jgi:tyrosine-protein phosphatase SIW14|nr:dual specificity protein phosphatase family protein [Bacteroidia bacterium]